MPDVSRRDFLTLLRDGLLAGSGLLALGGLTRFLSYQTEPPPTTEFDLGPAANYPIGSRTRLPEVPAILIHNASGFSALSLVCTHLGCTVEQKVDGSICPCHGSRYDEQGNVLRGPANRPLRALRVEPNAGGHLILHTD
ncbi:MAG: ubiquinol-cytochrome c reductase iron-sulfur subunit [Chloroflexi bacterium]|nr:ubiquinol-cytochrome c reductase iron-sulfur subunit [Chloroflexota bacterium]